MAARRHKLRTRVTLLFFLFSAAPAVFVSGIAMIVINRLINEEIDRRTQEVQLSTRLEIKNVTESVRAAVSTFAESSDLRSVLIEKIEQGDELDLGAVESALQKAANTSGLDLLAVVELREPDPVILASVHAPISIEKTAPLFARSAPVDTTTVGFAHEVIGGNPPPWTPAIIGVRALADYNGRVHFIVYGGLRLDTHRIEALALNGRARLVLHSPNLKPFAFPKDVLVEGSENDPAMIIPALAGGRAKPVWLTPKPGETIEPKAPTKMHVRVNTQQLEEARATFLTLAVALAGASVILALLAGALISRPIAGPILALAGAAQKIGEGDLDVRITPSSNDEVGSLVEVFNNMTAELAESRVRLQRAERIAAWREIARRVAHEIKNPLFPIQMAMETLRKGFRTKHPQLEEIVEESTRTVLEEVRALNQIVTEFSDFARLPAPKTEAIEPSELLEHARALFAGKASTAAGSPIDIVFDRTAIEARSLARVTADREQLGRTLLNLVKNAIEAMPPGGGRITLDAEGEVRGTRSGVALIVRDTGLGMPEDVRKQIFTPYFTTKKEGTGLGLAIVDRIVQEHQGAIDVDSTPGVGTVFKVWLPSQ